MSNSVTWTLASVFFSASMVAIGIALAQEPTSKQRIFIAAIAAVIFYAWWKIEDVYRRAADDARDQLKAIETKICSENKFYTRQMTEMPTARSCVNFWMDVAASAIMLGWFFVAAPPIVHIICEKQPSTPGCSAMLSQPNLGTTR